MIPDPLLALPVVIVIAAYVSIRFVRELSKDDKIFCENVGISLHDFYETDGTAPDEGGVY